MNITTKLIAISSAVSLTALTLAHAETQTFDFTGFSEIDASAGTDVKVTVGGDYSIRAEGDAEALERLRVELRGETLKIGRQNDRSFFTMGRKWRVMVYVTTPSLSGVDVSSGADLTASGIDAKEFTASVSSGADATLSGTCNNLRADGSSGADLKAADLKCSSAIADVSSGADLDIYASDSVTADASSGGDITVYGGPKNTNIDKSSGGGVSIRN
ncbi:head GIN domain-containing protein [Hyphococcus sp.]|uniref:head GIN domain-containing protein n=1 Tax=Hyphococcus sp. TaxID=2038636 RepID=UPI00208226D2|nr:MAG: hypothetical protein DHS20C04_12270 [Marinicaulis sp.]